MSCPAAKTGFTSDVLSQRDIVGAWPDLAVRRRNRYTLAPVQCQVHPNRPAAGRCARCRAPYCSEDQRRQIRGAPLCRACHLDPGLRLLPISIPNPVAGIDGFGARTWQWLARSLRTTLAVLTSPAACFRAVQEPVSLGPLVLYLWTLGAFSWCLSVLVSVLQAVERGSPRVSFTQGRVGDDALGAAAIDALEWWVLLMAPLGSVVTFFVVGTFAHLFVLMSGYATRTLGASLRAFAIACVPVLLFTYPAFVLTQMEWVTTEQWCVTAGIAALWGGGLFVLGISRSHDAMLLRGLVAALIPWLMLQGILVALASLTWEDWPFVLSNQMFE